MMIQRHNIGAHGKHTVYAICYDTGRKDSVFEELARFDTLETATNVLRYIRGDILTREQIADAVQAIRKIDEKEGA